MATTNGNRRILDLKRWEMCTPAPVASAASAMIISSRHYRQQQMYVQAAGAQYLYDPREDSWIQITSGALGTFAAGACGVATAVGPSGTATAGTTTTITTNLTLARDLRGYSIHITAGPNAGETRVIASNTIGANAVITVTVAYGTNITTSSVYRLLTPRWYVFGGGTLAAGSFRVYDFATNAWSSLATTGLPATFGTDGRMVSTPSWMDSDYYKIIPDSAVASATATTLVKSGATWTTNQFSNYQVRIVSGTGAGQIRTITSNTGTTLTVPTWTTTPDATSVFTIEGNDDFIYLMGNNAVTLYRYSISGNTWSTLSPGAARAAAPGLAASGHWIWGVTDAAWTSESNIQNGRYIYSFRGGAGAAGPLDRYDIALNTWSAITYATNAETFTTGTSYAHHDGKIYIQKDATGRWFYFDCVTHEMLPFSTDTYLGGAAVLGDRAFDVTYVDGATEIVWIYMLLNTSTVLRRCMVIP